MKRWRLFFGALVVALGVGAGTGLRAMTLQPMNLVSLLRNAEVIVIGDVQSVTDGIDGNGLPYTEVTLGIEETLRGAPTETYTFRQFGLTSPRLTEDGTKMMLAAPEGIPRYAEGQRALFFFAPPAEMTGLQSTVGLGQGRFDLGPGRAENDLANEGAFDNVVLNPALSTPNYDRILETRFGAVNGDDFLSLVRQAVQKHWVENCQMWDSEEGTTCHGGGHRPTDHATPPPTVNPGPTTPTGAGRRIGIK